MTAAAPANLMTLETWVLLNYNENWRPSVVTVRLWVKQGRIQPPPEKHGRRLMFSPGAKYVPMERAIRCRKRLVDRIGRGA